MESEKVSESGDTTGSESVHVHLSILCESGPEAKRVVEVEKAKTIAVKDNESKVRVREVLQLAKKILNMKLSFRHCF